MFKNRLRVLVALSVSGTHMIRIVPEHLRSDGAGTPSGGWHVSSDAASPSSSHGIFRGGRDRHSKGPAGLRWRSPGLPHQDAETLHRLPPGVPGVSPWCATGPTPERYGRAPVFRQEMKKRVDSGLLPGGCPATLFAEFLLELIEPLLLEFDAHCHALDRVGDIFSHFDPGIVDVVG